MMKFLGSKTLETDRLILRKILENYFCDIITIN